MQTSGTVSPEHLYGDIIGNLNVWETECGRGISDALLRILDKIPEWARFSCFTTPREIYVIAMPIQIMGLCIACCSPTITLDDDGDDDQREPF